MNRIDPPPDGETTASSNTSDTRASEQAPGTETRRLNYVRDQDDPEAWREFVEQYGLTVARFLVRKGLSEENAKELTRAIFSRISQSVPYFSAPRDRAQPWICRLAHVIWIEMLKNWKNEPGFQTIEAITPEEFADVFRVVMAFKNTWRRLVRERPDTAERDFRIFSEWSAGKTPHQIAQVEGMTEPIVGVVILFVQRIFTEEMQAI